MGASGDVVASGGVVEGVTLVLGAAASGKSRYAEALAEGAAGRPVLIATAEARDDEMAARIQRHQAARARHWLVVEEPLRLSERVSELSHSGGVIVIDCLTLWLANILCAKGDTEQEIRALVAALERFRGSVVCVANEVGWGIVPVPALARVFRDHAGRLNQAVADCAGCVVLVIAGLPLQLKPLRVV